MADVVARPFRVRMLVPGRPTRAEPLIRCWRASVVIVLALPIAFLGFRWGWVYPALFATLAALEWLAFFWMDRHRDWRGPFDA